MAIFEIVKLTSDGLLLAALCFLSYRILANGNISGKLSQLMMLDASLKGLIRDAESAGRGLNEELERREKNLERILTELASFEKRSAEARSGLNTEKESIERYIAVANKVGAELAKVIKAAHRAPVSPVDEVEPAVPTSREREEYVPEPPSFQPPVRQRGAMPPHPRGRTASRAGLASRIQKEMVVDQQIEGTTQRNREAARAVEQIAEPAPAAPSRAIANSAPPITNSDGASDSKPDSRLGVLGAMRRQVQTV